MTDLWSLTRAPDGSAAMCVICFEWTQREDLADVVGKPGLKWDICKPCAEREAVAAMTLWMAGRRMVAL